MTNLLDTRDPADLRPHPLLKLIPAIPDNDPRQVAKRADIDASGLIPPVNVTDRGEIVDPDSFDTWRAAKLLQIPKIPVNIVPAAQAATALFHSLHYRRQYTIGARAYLALKLKDQLLAEAEHRKLENLKKGQCFPEPHRCASGSTLNDFADQIGVSQRTVTNAAAVLKEFKSPKLYPFEVQGGPKDGAVQELTLKDYFEPLIFREFEGDEHEHHRPLGLAAVLKAIGYVKSSGRGESPLRRQQLELFNDALRAVALRLIRVDGPAQMRDAVHRVFERATDAQRERLLELAEIIEEEGKSTRP